MVKRKTPAGEKARFDSRYPVLRFLGRVAEWQTR